MPTLNASVLRAAQLEGWLVQGRAPSPALHPSVNSALQILDAIHSGPLDLDQLGKRVPLNRNSLATFGRELEALGLLYRSQDKGRNLYHLIE